MSKRENLNSDGGKGKYKEVLTLALLVGILPPTWAVISPYIGVHVGPIALIAAYLQSSPVWYICQVS